MKKLAACALTLGMVASTAPSYGYRLIQNFSTGRVTGTFPRRALSLVLERFNDGAAGEVDLSGELEGPLFGQLRDLEQFKRFKILRHTLTWDNGADFAPEFLRERAQVAAA